MQHSYFSPKQLHASKTSDDEDNFEKMKAAYNACLDEDKIKSIGAQPLVQVLDEIKAAYPVESLVKSDSAPTKDAILLLAKYGVSALVAAGTGADDRDPDTVVISVAPPRSFGLPSKERYEDEKLVEKYRAVAVQVLAALYPEHDKETFAKVIDLEKKLAAISPSTEDREDVTVSQSEFHLHLIKMLNLMQKYYNPMVIDEAAALTPEIQLTALLHDLAPENFVTKRIIVMAPAYMRGLSVILNETNKEVLQSYFVWKAVQSFSSYVDADEVKPYRQFVNVLAGKVRCSMHVYLSLCTDIYRIPTLPQSVGAIVLATLMMAWAGS